MASAALATFLVMADLCCSCNFSFKRPALCSMAKPCFVTTLFLSCYRPSNELSLLSLSVMSRVNPFPLPSSVRLSDWPSSSPCRKNFPVFPASTLTAPSPYFGHVSFFPCDLIPRFAVWSGLAIITILRQFLAVTSWDGIRQACFPMQICLLAKSRVCVERD